MWRSFLLNLPFFCPPLSVFYSHWSLGFWRESERERDLYIFCFFPSFSHVHLHPTTTPYLYSSVSKSDRPIQKKRADSPPGCLKPEALYCCNQASQRDTGVSNIVQAPIHFECNLFLIFFLPHNNKYLHGRSGDPRRMASGLSARREGRECPKQGREITRSRSITCKSRYTNRW